MFKYRDVRVEGAVSEVGRLGFRPLGGSYEMSLDVRGRSYVAEGAEVFHALLALRTQLEVDGLVLCVQGARFDVWPSGLLGQTGHGAYKHSDDPHDGRFQVVDIFAEADLESVVAVEAQRASVDEILERRSSARRDLLRGGSISQVLELMSVRSEPDRLLDEPTVMNMHHLLSGMMMLQDDGIGSANRRQLVDFSLWLRPHSPDLRGRKKSWRSSIVKIAAAENRDEITTFFDYWDRFIDETSS